METGTETRDETVTPAERIAEKASEIKREYAHGEDKPMGSHLTLVIVYNALVGGFLADRARSGSTPGGRPPVSATRPSLPVPVSTQG